MLLRVAPEFILQPFGSDCIAWAPTEMRTPAKSGLKKHRNKSLFQPHGHRCVFLGHIPIGFTPGFSRISTVVLVYDLKISRVRQSHKMEFPPELQFSNLAHYRAPNKPCVRFLSFQGDISFFGTLASQENLEQAITSVLKPLHLFHSGGVVGVNEGIAVAGVNEDIAAVSGDLDELIEGIVSVEGPMEEATSKVAFKHTHKF